MGISEDTADRLAADVIKHIEATGDEDIVTLIGKALGDNSQTLQELFITSVRVQRAAIRADQLIAARIEELERRALEPQPEPEPEPVAEAETEAAEAVEAEAPEPVDEEAERAAAAKRAREALERRRAERAAAEEAERKAQSEAAPRKGRRAVPQVKTDPRLG